MNSHPKTSPKQNKTKKGGLDDVGPFRPHITLNLPNQKQTRKEGLGEVKWPFRPPHLNLTRKTHAREKHDKSAFQLSLRTSELAGSWVGFLQKNLFSQYASMCQKKAHWAHLSLVFPVFFTCYNSNHCFFPSCFSILRRNAEKRGNVEMSKALGALFRHLRMQRLPFDTLHSPVLSIFLSICLTLGIC